jgi:hypothetical protein
MRTLTLDKAAEHDAMRSALAQLLDVCKRMDAELDAERPDEEEYQQTLRDAEAALQERT